MQHHLSHRFGVRLLVGTEYGPLTPPPARERHVLHRVALPLRRPLSPEEVPHSSGLRGEVGQLIRSPQPTVEHVPAARLGPGLRGREDRRVFDRLLPPPCGRERAVHCVSPPHHPLLPPFV